MRLFKGRKGRRSESAGVIGPDEEDLPSADTIASDFQRFLRQRGPEGPER